MSHLFDIVMSIEMFVGLMSGILLASLVGWIFPSGQITNIVQVVLVGLGLGGGIMWTILSFFHKREERNGV